MPLCMLCDAFCGVPARATHAYRCARRSRATAASNAPIASARTPEQLEALMAAPGVKLIQAEVDALDEASEAFA